jgi:DNA repair exonuclease SbcCD nuclease subunit
METSILVVGDVHVKLDNLLEIQTLEQRLVQAIETHRPDLFVFLGDVLHTHERVHTNCLNQAAQLFRAVSARVPTYVLVGNHDYISNSQFLSDHHWMNPFKQWPNLTIVDRVMDVQHHEHRLVMCPYVPDGRFVEALETLGAAPLVSSESLEPSDLSATSEPSDPSDLSVSSVPRWRSADMIFAHQTLDGVKMGMTIADGVETWRAEYPYCCSGHIHDRQTVAPNLYYCGTPMPHAFGESNDKTVSLYRLGSVRSHLELRLDVCTKRIEYLTLAEAQLLHIEPKPHQQIRLTVKASPEEARAFKRSEKYRQLVQLGVKIVLDDKVETVVHAVRKPFEAWLLDGVKDSSAAFWYRRLVGRIETDPDVVFDETFI